MLVLICPVCHLNTINFKGISHRKHSCASFMLHSKGGLHPFHWFNVRQKANLNLENESQPECPPLLTDINIYIQGCEQEAILNFCEQYRGAKRRPKNHLIIAKCINILYIAMVFCNLYCIHTYVCNYTFNFANFLNVSMCTSELRRDFY